MGTIKEAAESSTFQMAQVQFNTSAKQMATLAGGQVNAIKKSSTTTLVQKKPACIIEAGLCRKVIDLENGKFNQQQINQRLLFGESILFKNSNK